MQLRDARWGCSGLAGVARKPRQLTLRVWLKFAFGLLLMACGFMCWHLMPDMQQLTVKRQWA